MILFPPNALSTFPLGISFLIKTPKRLHLLQNMKLDSWFCFLGRRLELCHLTFIVLLKYYKVRSVEVLNVSLHLSDKETFGFINPSKEF